MDVDTVKDRLAHEVERRADVLLEISHSIHEHPELCYEEHHAHDLLAGVLEDEGFDVERGAAGMDTAFVAKAGTGDGPTIGVFCEYDALPEIGHACGHNVIGAAGLGAGLAAATVAEELGGRVVVLGSPAEEGGGGKVFLEERGALDGLDAAMMIHPADGDLQAMNVIAIQQVHVEYHGLAAHAAAFPHKGRNALDAAVLGYMNVAALRQHIRPTERIHGVFTDAGDKPNIVPKYAAAEWYVRSPTLRLLQGLKERVLTCLEAGALASGCTMDHEWQDPAYADMISNPVLVDLFSANAERTGRNLADPDLAAGVVGSTDMGNVSYVVPSLHPMLAVAPPGISIHTPEFTAFARGEEGDRAVLDGARAMAMTVVDLWLDPSRVEAAKASFDEAVATRR
ncbi:MAG: M20 family metallopeptidase [Acidimicrobiales bacterium]